MTWAAHGTKVGVIVGAGVVVVDVGGSAGTDAGVPELTEVAVSPEDT